MRIVSEVQSFLLGHMLVVVGTRDDRLSPEFARGFGVRIDPGGEAVQILVSRREWPATIANIEANSALAMTASEPETYRTYQLKGRATLHPANAADCLLAKAYAQKMSDRLNALGVPWAVIGYYFVLDDLVVVRLQVTEIFIQTPGPNAGQPIGDGLRTGNSNKAAQDCRPRAPASAASSCRPRAAGGQDDGEARQRRLTLAGGKDKGFAIKGVDEPWLTGCKG